MKQPRSLLIPCLLALSLVQLSTAVDNYALINRQGQATGGTSNTVTTGPTDTGNQQQPSSQPPDNPPSDTNKPPPSDTQAPPASNTDNNQQPSNTPPPTSQPPQNTQVSAPPQDTPTQAPPSQVVTTDSAGDAVTETLTIPASQTSSAQPSASSSAPADESTGLGTGSIIGLSVAGGIAVLGIIGFFVWKFTRKKFSDFDDNEAIKWPELNAHKDGGTDIHPLPVHSTGRSGFDTGSEVSLSRAPSNSNQTYSTTDLVGSDPYAVPPLPHLNPNQPYHDDPAAGPGYYDPYHGPVPGTFRDTAGSPEWGAGGEAIPMTQMAGGNGRMSPGPALAYGEGAPSITGRMSPAPQVALGGRQSPGPQMGLGGRQSPGPQMGLGGRQSPGPQMGLGGRSSPGPRVAYDAYGAPR